MRQFVLFFSLKKSPDSGDHDKTGRRKTVRYVTQHCSADVYRLHDYVYLLMIT